MKSPKKQAPCILCMILGVAIIIVGISVMNPETYQLGSRDSLGFLIEFGGDYQTEMYHITYQVAHQVQKAYVNICNAIGWLIVALGVIDISYFIYKFMSITEQADQENTPKTTYTSAYSQQAVMQAQKSTPIAESKHSPQAENTTPIKTENSFSEEYWVCGKCKTKNLNSRTDCWSCGNPK